MNSMNKYKAEPMAVPGDLKQLEHERIMIHQARCAAMDEALGIIAHKWRQPLNAIALSVQNLTDAWE